MKAVVLLPDERKDVKYDSDSSLQEVRSQRLLYFFSFSYILSSVLVISLYKSGLFKIV